ncbi:MAG: transglycosylase SLT domain-containing protein [Chloracidobacterium sp.]|nr:transglycosylase SLT domain-containing protein [Chloracidobacterium sp.]
MINNKTFVLMVLTGLLSLMAVSCSAQQTEEQALESLRQMTRDGKLPAEDSVAAIESKFSDKRAGALARLLRARIRFDNKDFAGSAELLDSDAFAQRTELADYALWLRGRSLQQTGDHALAKKVFETLYTNYPGSLRASEARLLWAESAVLSGDALKVNGVLAEMLEQRHPGALIAAARAYEALGDQPNATVFYRRTYFYGAGSSEAKEAEAKLAAAELSLTPRNAEEITARAVGLMAAGNFAEADKAFAELIAAFPAEVTADTHLKRLKAFVNLKKMADAQSAFNVIPASAPIKETAFYELVTGYAKNRLWPDARRAADEMRRAFPDGKLTVKAWVDAGFAARDARIKGEEQYFLGAALANYPNAVEVAQAQFELAWLAHEAGEFSRSSQLLIEHLARYVDRDTTNRGRAGYWAARDSERAGKTDEACVLYEAVIYRYLANWYGYQAEQRLGAMRSDGKCGGRDGRGVKPLTASHSLLAKAEANLKTVTVAPETAGPGERRRAEKSLELSTVGLFDWSLDELNAARKTAPTSPSINLALARHHRNKGDNVSALLALAKSYPDYSQMFPEEMGQEEWDIFYPHVAWDQIAAWARNRKLDIYQVAGLIRQESVFNPRARSHANAYGLMQLILPTARSVARKYGSTATITVESLFQPALNIELGTAYMRDQLDKFGRIEFMAVAYNAGPGRVPQWRASLPAEMDEFVEAIPFRETKGYVQGVIRNSAQYRRLYDEKGNFKPHVGSRPVRTAVDTATRTELAAEFPDVVLSTDSPGGE